MKRKRHCCVNMTETIKADCDYFNIEECNSEYQYCIDILSEYLQELQWKHSQVCNKIKHSIYEKNICKLKDTLQEVIKAEIEVAEILESLKTPKITVLYLYEFS